MIRKESLIGLFSFFAKNANSFMERRMVMKTLKNKLYGGGLILAGIVPMILDGDATALIMLGMVGVPLLFAKTNWIDD